jgi:GH35 family endo-1,4-beta-xylanase
MSQPRLIGLLCFLIAYPLCASPLEERIEKHRTGFIVIQGPPHTAVKVTQCKHEFWFGSAISNRIFDGGADERDVRNFKEKFLLHFNCAVTENALKWGTMERSQGQVDFAATDRMLKWTDDNDLPLRGHNIFWGIPNFIQGWVKSLDDEALLQALRTRAYTVAGRYRDRFAEYDLNNEMIHGNYYEQRLGPTITRRMAAWVKEIDPHAVLYLNDYDILTGHRLEDYVEHIKGLQAQGVQFDGIGVQGHLHGEDFDQDALQAALDRLAVFRLPIRITEFNMPGQRSRFYKDRKLRLTSEQEQQKARNLVDYYRICFAHPAVEGILMWGFWEGANWIPASSLYRLDWTPTAAAQAYLDLVRKAWWTDVTEHTDQNGRCTVRAFFGTHRIDIDGRSITVELKKKQGAVKVDMP